MTRRRLSLSGRAIWPLLLAVLVLLSACGGEKTPKIILVTATPTPGPAVLIVTATPSPLPPVIVTATPQSLPSATVTVSQPNSGSVWLPLVWQSHASPP